VLILNYKTKFVNRIHSHTQRFFHTRTKAPAAHMKSNTFWPFSYLKTPINYVFVPFLSLSVLYYIGETRMKLKMRECSALENKALLLGKKRCNLSSISCSMAEISRTSYLTREIKLQHVILRRAKQANHSPFSHTKQAYPPSREQSALSCFPFRITIDFCLARQ
jgi:hypothetical protein